MAAREIRTTIALDGEKEFKRALTDARREMTVLGSEMKAARADFDNTGDAQTFLTKKTKVLDQQLKQQQAIVKALEGAVADMAKTHGDASKEVQEMTIRLNDARAKTSKLEKEFRDAEKEAKDLGRGLDKNVEKEAKASAKAVDSLSDKLEGLQGDVSKIKGMGGIELGMDILGNAKDWAQQFLEWGREGRDYLRQEVMTQYRSERAGLSQEFVDEQINRVGALIGDREEARSGIGTLLNIEGLDENSLKTYVDNLVGLYLLNPWASFSGLAEGLQQTASNRDLDGQYKEALERLGYTAKELENINDQLKKGIDQTDAAGIALTPLVGKGVLETLARYENEQKPLITEEFAEQQADRAGKSAMAAIGTSGIGEGANVFKALALDAVAWALGGETSGTVRAYQKRAQEMYKDVNEYWAKNAPQNWYEEMLKAEGRMLPEGYRREDVDPSMVRAWWNNMWGKTEEWGAPKLTEKERAEAIKQSFFDAGAKGTLQMGLDQILGGMTLKDLFQQMMQETDDAAEDAKTGGEAIGNGLKAGLEMSGAEAVTAARGIASSITAELSRIAVPNIPSMVASAGGYSIGGALSNVAVNLDGRRVGQLVTPYVSKNQGRTV